MSLLLQHVPCHMIAGSTLTCHFFRCPVIFTHLVHLSCLFRCHLFIQHATAFQFVCAECQRWAMHFTVLDSSTCWILIAYLCTIFCEDFYNSFWVFCSQVTELFCLQIVVITSYIDHNGCWHMYLSTQQSRIGGSWGMAYCLSVNKLNDLQQNFSNQDNRWSKRLQQQITLLIPLSPVCIIAAVTPSPAAVSPLPFKPERQDYWLLPSTIIWEKAKGFTTVLSGVSMMHQCLVELGTAYTSLFSLSKLRRIPKPTKFFHTLPLGPLEVLSILKVGVQIVNLPNAILCHPQPIGIFCL